MTTVVIALKGVPNGLNIGGYIVKGPQKQVPGEPVPEHYKTGGFALTPGVPKEVWDAWYKANENSHIVKEGLIFASDDANIHSALMMQGGMRQAIPDARRMIMQNAGKG